MVDDKGILSMICCVEDWFYVLPRQKKDENGTWLWNEYRVHRNTTKELMLGLGACGSRGEKLL